MILALSPIEAIFISRYFSFGPGENMVMLISVIVQMVVGVVLIIKTENKMKQKRIITINTYSEFDRYCWFDARPGDILRIKSDVSVSWKALMKLPKDVFNKIMCNEFETF